MADENIFVLPSADQFDELNSHLVGLYEAKVGKSIKAYSWAQVQQYVRRGFAKKIFAIGDQLSCQKGDKTLYWDIIGIDYDTPADPRFTHSLTLQLHNCLPILMQFDAPEALYYCHSLLEAGTHHFEVSGTNYQFTTSEDIAAGSQLMLAFTGNVPSGITVADTKGGAVSEGSIAVTAGSGGEQLNDNYLNDINRVQYGNDNYGESAIRQWLNSSAAAGSFWTPQNDFDRPPNWHTGEGGTTKQAGFMNDLDADFLAVLGNVTKITAKDNSGSNTTTEKFFPLSRSEVYGGLENSVNEGAAYPYYVNYSGLGNTAGIGADSNRIRYRNDTEPPTPQNWWLRTPYYSDAFSVRYILQDGTISNVYARGNINVAPACCVI